MNVSDVMTVLEELSPLGQAEDFDNVGLLVGDRSAQVTGILVTLDTLEEVVDEAVRLHCNLIVSFHPIIFTGLKQLRGDTYVERTVIKAIQNRIAIYSMHTALDNAFQGVNAQLCKVLGVKRPKILIPRPGSLKKLVTYVPVADSESLKTRLFEAGAGNIGQYSDCSFAAQGIGSYRAGSEAQPTKGTIGELHHEPETQIHVVFSQARQQAVIKALLEHHPYEEVAYEVTPLDNPDPYTGMGMVGELTGPMGEKAFLDHVKERLESGCIRHSDLLGKPILKVAVLGGSGAFAIGAAKASGADILLTADLKYHDFFRADGKIVLADIGHFESERFTKNLLAEYLTIKIPNFAIRLSGCKTNPINYL